MSLRVALRNWLLKPSKQELSGDKAAVEQAGTLVFGHILRDMQRELEETGSCIREIPSLPEGWDR